MKNSKLINYGITSVVILFLNSCQENQNEMKAPIAEKIKKELTIHGDSRIDNYYWLKERENPNVLEYLKAENAYTNAVLAHTEKLQEKIYNEIVGRIEQTDMSVPYFFNEYYYYNRFEEGKEYPIYCRKKGSMEAEEEIMLNVNEMAEGYEYFRCQD